MGLSLVASTDLGALVDRFVGSRAPSDDPLAREVVVVPTVVVGQWFEQAVATRTGQPGRGDGVAANLDLIFLRGLVGLALYG
ncbi:MAG: exodeoxyribonuclease V subunit gamma, partial [Acidimicrobiales bacterium]